MSEDIEKNNEQPVVPAPDEGSSELQVLKRKLYARDEAPELAERTKKLGDVPARKGERYGKAQAGESPAVLVDALQRRTSRRRKIIRLSLIIGGLVLVFIAAVSATVWYRNLHQLRQDQIVLDLKSPTEFTSGEHLDYEINYRNDSLEKLQNVEIFFEAPEGFRVLESSVEARREGAKYLFTLPDIEPGKGGVVVVKGILVGEQNTNALAKAEIGVSPANAPRNRYTKVATATTVIVAVPIEVSVEASSSAISGERIFAVVHVRNVSSLSQEGLFLKLQAPPGMQLAPEDKEFSAEFSAQDGIWQLPSINPLEEVVRTAVLYVDGSAGERRPLEIEVGVKDGEETFIQRKVSHVVTVTASELSVVQSFNKKPGDQVVSAGQKLQGSIAYQNTGTVGLKSVVVSAKFEGTGLDPASLQLKNGAYNPTTKTITWTSATVPELTIVAPNQSGEITYDFSLLPAASFPIVDGKGNNNVVTVIASVDSPDVKTPLGQEKRIVSERVNLEVATSLSLDVVAFYDDGRLGLPSTGPLPPKVGEQTTYTLRFRLGSTLNDVGDVRLTAVLPDGVSYTGKTYLTTGKVEHNERTGEVIWKVPLIEALTGRTTPPAELHVQIAVTPGENTKGKEIQLLNVVNVEGMDEFVDQLVKTEITDRFPTTDTAVPGKGKVQ
ncbi:MAG: hypothetical protein HYZ63_00400 [Candidatus Andersenbacteria bacterium]|nr:hypothetical protein [Candidatus Andersenbacteria bacterium]